MFDWLVDFFFEVLYKTFSSICVIIDFIKTIFFKLCGIETVSIGGTETDLLSNLITSDKVRTSFLIITLIGFILLFVFTIIAIVKTSYQEKQNWKTILTKSSQSLIILFLLPFTILAGILLTNVIMGSVNDAMQGGTGGVGTIGGQFLLTIGTESYIGKASERLAVESMFVSGELDYANLSVVKTYYDINSMNYVIALLGSLVILFTFVLSSLTFVQRIFDIILLYLISPISTSTIPLDEGARFKRWKDLLIAKILSAYGIILVMNLFFLIIPQVYQIDFFGDKFHNGIVYILFLIGGSFAVTKAARLIGQLTGGDQGGRDLVSVIYSVRTGMAMAKGAASFAGGLATGFIGGSDFKMNRKKGKTFSESLQSAVTSNRNQRMVDAAKKVSKRKQFGAMPLRLATMPFGMMHDIARGGVIQMGKNFVPRCKNLVGGDSLVSRADIKKEIPKSKPKEEDKPKADPKPKDTSSDRKNTITEDKDKEEHV